MASGSGARGANLNWEKFEELAKVAFVADPHADTRFFLKTRVVPDAKAAKGQKKPIKPVVQIVARVSTRPRKNDGYTGDSGGGKQHQVVSAQSIKYQTPMVSNLSRLTRLLRFVMQEVLGPMKPAFTTTATAASTNATLPVQTGASAPPSNTSKSKKKKKKGGKK